LRASDPGHVEGNPVFAYLERFAPDPAEVENLKTRYRAGQVGDVEVKTRLAEILNTYLAPHRARRAELMNHPEDLLALLRDGTARAQNVARETFSEVREVMGLSQAALDV
jgi:tryptophanyl-tRNA synthetase